MSDMPGNDYASVVKFRLEGVHDWQSEEGATDATNLAAALDAQATATLALAYEQRTANLIALYNMTESNCEGLSTTAPMSRANWDAAAKQIKERLGLS